MPQIATPQGLALEYETAGSPSDPPLLLVTGFGTQLIAWPRRFCERLAAGGRFVISFDNRDAGLSSKMDGQGTDISLIATAAAAGDFEQARELAAYTLSDMSDDGLELLTALGIERAHIAGASMGGMIAQTMAIEHPERLLTLTSMMSTTGEPEFGQPTPEARQALLTPAPASRAGYVDAAERSMIWRSKRYADVEAVRKLAGESYDRCYSPDGVTRQLGAIIASGSRAEQLRRVTAPTRVMHGLDDTLIAPSGGERTAALIPHARLLLLENMGHDRPEPLWPQICGAILEHSGQPLERSFSA
jgi:pimeloyl-ACP methyl ester carboxylesterase